MAIILFIKTEDGLVTELPILGKVTMGRSSSSDYKIADAKMSGVHCSFEKNSKGQVVFTDLESTNGSFLNNSIIRQTLVRVNDVIRIGNTLIKIDDKRLNSSERIAVGVSLAQKADKTLPGGSTVGGAVPLPKKKTVVLNKDIKAKKKVASNWNGAENVVDQEETGHTKFLKLDKKKK